MATKPRDAYDRWAAQYDTDANDTRELNAEVPRKQPFIENDDAVLELGCGTGLKNTQWLAAQVGHVVATDVSDEMLIRARERLDSESVTLRTLDVTALWPFEAGRFDAVVATPVLEHVETLGPVFREARRVVRDGGTFYLTELHSYRQFVGRQAHVEDEATGETIVIDAFTHPVSEFVNTGVEAGFVVREMGEWRAEGDEKPRLLMIRVGAGPDAGTRSTGQRGSSARGRGLAGCGTHRALALYKKSYSETDSLEPCKLPARPPTSWPRSRAATGSIMRIASQGCMPCRRILMRDCLRPKENSKEPWKSLSFSVNRTSRSRRPTM
ncbi:MAG: class I SAM-dependent methyltransferase [Salinibacter sp.]|uniref:class I SAM-dependent methyltransferase n=1 Tax=Salinibacter sp. TaxID=2065818 RepID=UPI0035D48A76